MDDASDHDLIERVLLGDIEQYARLVDRHYDRCARVASRIVGNREDAEEAIQDTFLRAFRALESYDDRDRFSAWLTRILVNQCRTVLARTRRRELLFADLELDSLGQLAAPGDAGHDWPELDHALSSLPVEQREALVLRYADDLTYDEMARITGAGTSALKMRVQRAFARLRLLLGEAQHV